MDLLKSPRQLLLEEAGAHANGDGLLMTPQQMIVQETGIIPKFAQGKQVLSPEDMKAELFVEKTKSPKAHSHPALVKAWNNFFK
jgi:hypothetical protein